MKTLAKNERLHHIDILRGIAIFSMILIHTNTYFLSNKTVYFLWDISQFAVPVFIFCSTYLFFYKNTYLQNKNEVFNYVKKRFLRLLIPYSVFAFIFMGVIFLKEPQKLTANYIFQTLTITGGIDINWLVLLFICFTFVMVFLSYTINKNRLLFYTYFGVSLLSSVFLIFFHFPLNYRYIMWLPWSLIVIVSYFVAKYEKNRQFLFVSFIISLLIYILLLFIQLSLHHSLAMYDNKYPPNLFHLSYGIVSIFVLLWLSHTRVFKIHFVSSFFNFLSKYSYSLFFIHYSLIFILILFFHFKFTWVSFFITVLVLSVIVQIAINRLIFLILFAAAKTLRKH